MNDNQDIIWNELPDDIFSYILLSINLINVDSFIDIPAPFWDLFCIILVLITSILFEYSICIPPVSTSPSFYIMSKFLIKTFVLLLIKIAPAY